LAKQQRRKKECGGFTGAESKAYEKINPSHKSNTVEERCILLLGP